MHDPIDGRPETERSRHVSVPLAGNGTDEVSNAALAALREDVLPSAHRRVDGAETAVAGRRPSRRLQRADESSVPYVFGFVLALAFLLLLVAFRSVVIAAKAIVLNLLSVGAAYGLLVPSSSAAGARACSASSPPAGSRRGCRSSSS